MTIKDLLVTVDGSDAAPSPVELAAWLAIRFEAHLVGLHPSSTARVDFYAARFDTSQFDDGMRRTFEALEQRAVAARTGFDAVTARNGLTAEWRVSGGLPGPDTVQQARYADLVVLRQRWSDYDGLRYPDPADVVLDAGCAVLIIPAAGRFDRIERHALIAWNASREAARAVHDALPLLKSVERVTVLAVDPKNGTGAHGAEPGADIARHLARHGLKVDVERSSFAGTDTADELLSRASELGSDLIVMGAYGHSRMREMILGGVTRSMLDQMTVPVLMSH